MFDVENCALGKDCHCTGNRAYWHCRNWGRSRLSAPNIHSAYKQPLDKVRNHTAAINQRLADIRHSRKGRGK